MDMLTSYNDVAVPDGVQSLRVIGRGSYHVTLRWAVPMERNGILTGYIVGYRRGERPSHTDSIVIVIIIIIQRQHLRQQQQQLLHQQLLILILRSILTGYFSELPEVRQTP